jgi:hypothetical protein
MNPQGNPTSPQFGPNGPTIPLPNNAGQQINLQTGQVQPPQPFGAPAPGAPGAPPNPALDLINAQLRGQRPQDPNATAAPGNFGSGGIAGVASTFKGPSIKVYNERQKYQEWEFIFDPKKGMPGQQGVPQNSNPLGSPGLGSPGLGSPGLGSPGLGSANPQPPANPLQPPPPKQ